MVRTMALISKLRIEVSRDQIDVFEQLAEPLEGVILALNRDNYLTGGGEAVHRDQAERRRTVDDRVVERVVERFDGPP